MKVLIVNKFLHPNGGSETYIFELGRQLARMGHSVQYFGMEHEGRIVGNRIGCYTDDMDFHSGKWEKLFYPFRILYSRQASARMKKVLSDFDPNVVHLNNFNFQLTPSVIYAVRKYEKHAGKKIRIVYTAHDPQLVCPSRQLRVPGTGELCTRCLGGRQWNCAKYRCIHNSRVKSLLGSLEGRLYERLKTYRYLDVIVCPSRFMEGLLRQNSALCGRTVVLHNFIGAIEPPAADKKDYVLYFGRYSREKGIDTLLEACRRLPHIPFVFAGKGPLEEQVNSMENIENKGFLNGPELYALIAGARFTVFPSECYENCPFSVMESQVCRTPVIASRLGGTPELLLEEKTGEFFEAGNAAQLAERIQKLWEDRKKLARYTENCRAVSFAGASQYCEKLLQLYQEG